MGRLSQGAKAGLAAGLVLGLMIGLLHLTTLESCSASQISYIQTRLSQQIPPSNSSASSLFATDVVYYPMVNGVWAFVYGEIFGVVFALVYSYLPGRNSKKKGILWGAPVFLITVFAGPGAILYSCSPSFIPDLATIGCLPVSLAFGYLLGTFFDAFGRLAIEKREEIVGKKKSSSDGKVRLAENCKKSFETFLSSWNKHTKVGRYSFPHSQSFRTLVHLLRKEQRMSSGE